MILLPPQRKSVCLKHTSKHNFNLSWCDYRDFPHIIYITLSKDDSVHAHHFWCEVWVADNVYNYIKLFAGFSVNCVTVWLHSCWAAETQLPLRLFLDGRSLDLARFLMVETLMGTFLFPCWRVMWCRPSVSCNTTSVDHQNCYFLLVKILNL